MPETITEQPEEWWVRDGEARLFSYGVNPVTTSITFSAGKGQVIINTDTGAVQLKDCGLPEAAKAFWQAVAHYCPRKASQVNETES